ncbi:hypothetical protein K493DRAFT_339004 [Basidiobolus meristosporus CBS 931.73]|uniref:Transcription factor TFIIIC triple barrel domain-containing protein n=1 Tax=Basidiobolus meristosporus CBS 931.73 TaxID=1314790 RepID=A0A1Y1Y226_9FUNG|nr:hypothetical protein K493DRAFT_339004 [Basidiobolus meristosporus CBS 931.73]|eukprot:ORX92071.1 hypothetical protein K493DRAFT_339004 [Basidiobolus meristosporus CBS 931.73]
MFAEQQPNGYSDDEYEYEEEVNYIVLDLGTEVTTDMLKSSGTDGYSLMGLDTESPYLKIGNMVFKGQYDETLGTELVFCPSGNTNSTQQKTETSEAKEVKYFCHTTKKITLSKVNLQPKLSKDRASEEVDTEMREAETPATPTMME